VNGVPLAALAEALALLDVASEYAYSPAAAYAAVLDRLAGQDEDRVRATVAALAGLVVWRARHRGDESALAEWVLRMRCELPGWRYGP
jgi:hypothetical protein